MATYASPSTPQLLEDRETRFPRVTLEGLIEQGRSALGRELFPILVRIRPTIWLYTSRQRTCYTVVVPFMSCQARLPGTWPMPIWLDTSLSGVQKHYPEAESSFPARSTGRS